MASYTLSHQAYLKIIFHAAKHPHKPVNGVLLGKQTATSVLVTDAVPLLHLWTNLSPMMEIGLDLARTHADALGLQVVGYYQATERLDDRALAPVGEKVASKIKENFNDAFALVVDGEKMGTEEPALIPYIANGTSWHPHNSAFAGDSPFTLENQKSPSRAMALIRERGLHRQFGDFDDHLEDVTVDWLNNAGCTDKGAKKT
ncbi:hypothetical protein JB92DRAFT_2891762 [Gautieria morchelliformis]|nr:hypothetical protein JB92DRAFT_2891762 [Gautieria morchelliformis]